MRRSAKYLGGVVLCAVAITMAVQYDTSHFVYEWFLFVGVSSIIPWVGCLLVCGLPVRWFPILTDTVVLCGMAVYGGLVHYRGCWYICHAGYIRDIHGGRLPDGGIPRRHTHHVMCRIQDNSAACTASDLNTVRELCNQEPCWWCVNPTYNSRTCHSTCPSEYLQMHRVVPYGVVFVNQVYNSHKIRKLQPARAVRQ